MPRLFSYLVGGLLICILQIEQRKKRGAKNHLAGCVSCGLGQVLDLGLAYFACFT